MAGEPIDNSEVPVSSRSKRCGPPGLMSKIPGKSRLLFPRRVVGDDLGVWSSVSTVERDGDRTRDTSKGEELESTEEGRNDELSSSTGNNAGAI